MLGLLDLLDQVQKGESEEDPADRVKGDLDEGPEVSLRGREEGPEGTVEVSLRGREERTLQETSMVELLLNDLAPGGREDGRPF